MLIVYFYMANIFRVPAQFRKKIRNPEACKCRLPVLRLRDFAFCSVSGLHKQSSKITAKINFLKSVELHQEYF